MHILNNLISIVFVLTPDLSEFSSKCVTVATLIAGIIGLAASIITLLIIYKRRERDINAD